LNARRVAVETSRLHSKTLMPRMVTEARHPEKHVTNAERKKRYRQIVVYSRYIIGRYFKQRQRQRQEKACIRRFGRKRIVEVFGAFACGVGDGARGHLYVPAQAQTGGAAGCWRALCAQGRARSSTVRQGTLGRLSSFHRCNHSELTLFDPDLIPLQHLVEGNANVVPRAPCSTVECKPGEWLSGCFRSSSRTDSYIFHIHYDLPISFADAKRPLVPCGGSEELFVDRLNW